MGRIKSAGIKRAANTLLSKNDSFTTDFNENKKILSEYTLPDKFTRNKIAGYLVRLKKYQNALKAELANKKE